MRETEKKMLHRDELKWEKTYTSRNAEERDREQRTYKNHKKANVSAPRKTIALLGVA